jgi:class 3 adenylate cyclase
VLDAIREFVGIEPATPDLDTVLSTVLFTDVVGSTQRQAALGDGGGRPNRAAPRDRPRGAWALAWARVGYGPGTASTRPSDGLARAIRCAIEIGRRLRDIGIEIRAGVHTGECQLIDGKIGGITVSIGRGWRRRPGHPRCSCRRP